MGIRFAILFATVVVSTVSLIYIFGKSRLSSFSHKIIFFFVLNYLTVFLEWLVNNGAPTEERYFFATYFAFGPLLFLFVFSSLFPRRITAANRYWYLLFIPLLLEGTYVCYLDMKLAGYFSEIVEEESVLLSVASFFQDHSIHYFLLLLLASIVLLWFGQFVRKVRLLYAINTIWLWGFLVLLSIVTISEMLLDVFGSSEIQLIIILLLAIYLHLFLSFETSLLDRKGLNYQEVLKELFAEDKVPALLLNTEFRIVFANDVIIRLTGWQQHKLLGKYIQFLSETQQEEDLSQSTAFEGKFDLKLAKGDLLSCQADYKSVANYDGEDFWVVEVREYEIISKSTDNEVVKQLEALFEVENIYLRTDLQQSDVAERVGLSKRKLGELIMQHYQRTYPAFINSQRLKHAQKLLENSASIQMSLEEIGQASGFSSKTSFYTIFKKEMGMTPGEYQQKKGN